MPLDHIAAPLGYAGVVANMVWPLLRSRKRLLLGQTLACALMLGHFYLLGAYSGAAVMAVAGVQTALAIPLGAQPKFRYLYLASLLLTPPVCLLTWVGPQSVFSSLAMGIFNWANFQLNEFRQRCLLIVVILCWYAHNLLAHSVPGLISNTLALLISTHMVIIVYRAQRVRDPGPTTKSQVPIARDP